MPLPLTIRKKIDNMTNLILRNSELDIKTKALIAVSAAVSSYCSHCHGQSKKIARHFGLTAIEIKEAEEIAMQVREKCKNKTWLYKIN